MRQDKRNPSEFSSVDLNKKRKLQEEQLGLPSPKHKFRDRSSDFHGDSSIKEGREVREKLHGCTTKGKMDVEVDDRQDQYELVRDSNSFTGEFNIAMFVDDGEANYEMGPMKAHYYDQPSTSSGSCSINNYGNTPCYPANGTVERANATEKLDPSCAKLASAFTEEHLVGYAMSYPDFICEELENMDNEENMDLTINSNSVASDLYVLSSGRWNADKETQQGMRKATIDQEFEQYFSTLML